MERIEYDKLNRCEDVMWWFAGLHQNLQTVFQRRGSMSPRSMILDAGCGTGGLLRKLGRDLPNQVLGIVVDEAACLMAREKSSQIVCVGSVNLLPFADKSFSAIFSADVLHHSKVDDHLALREFYRCLAPNGLVVINLPAFQWLLSAHDRAYTRHGVITEHALTQCCNSLASGVFNRVIGT